MTKVLSTLLAVFVSFSAFAGPQGMKIPQTNSLMKYIIESGLLRDFALHTLIVNRCDSYAPSDIDCGGGVSTLLEVLDYDIKLIDSDNPNPESTSWKPDRFVFVAFKKNFIEILRSPKSSIYLDELNGHLNKKIYQPSYDFNVRDFTIAFYKSEAVANMVLAALFQDASPLMLHVQYLDFQKIPGNKVFQENKVKLVQVIQLVNQIMDQSEQADGKLFYPKELAASLYKNIYHFYVPVYIAQTMKSMGYTTAAAKTIPFMMTLTYEFITASEDYTYLFADPDFLNPKEHDWKLRDIYGGYTGSRYGTGTKSKMNTFSEMSSRFAKSTLTAVKALLR